MHNFTATLPAWTLTLLAGISGITAAVALRPSSTAHQTCYTFQQLLRHSGVDFATMPQHAAQNSSRPSLPVRIKFYTEKFRALSDESLNLDVSLFVEAQWDDARFHNITQYMEPCADVFQVPTSDYSDVLWLPRLNFQAVHKIKEEKMPESSNTITIHKNGTVWAHWKYRLWVPCYLNLRKFPMDDAKCTVLVTSIDYEPVPVKLSWQPHALEVLLNRETAQHRLKRYHTTVKQVALFGVASTELYIVLDFQRFNGWYILHAYVPSYLIIFVSWLYNCLGQETMAGRLQLGSSLVVAILLVFSHLMRQVPKVGYVTALDVWLFLCLGFLALSISQDTIVVLLQNKVHACRDKLMEMRRSAKDRERYAATAMAMKKPRTTHFMNGVRQVTNGVLAVAADSTCENNPAFFMRRRSSMPDGCYYRELANSTSEGEPSSEDADRYYERVQLLTNGVHHRRPLMYFHWQHKMELYKNWALRIDKSFILLYPVLFIISNIIYWIYYFYLA